MIQILPLNPTQILFYRYRTLYGLPLASRREMRKGEAAPGERKMKAQYFSKGMKSIRTPKF